jgi:hypothetical protein
MENPQTNRRTLTRTSKALITLAFIAVAVITVTTTLGYLVSQSQAAVNTVTLGSIGVKVEEKFTEGQTPKPGDTITKEPTVKNSTNTPAYIRVRVVDGGVWETYYENELGYNSGNWTKGDDGYYYYNAVLPGKGETSAIFDLVKLKETANISDAGQLNIIVYAEAVQQWVDTSEFDTNDETLPTGWDSNSVAATAYKSFWALNHGGGGGD